LENWFTKDLQGKEIGSARLQQAHRAQGCFHHWLVAEVSSVMGRRKVGRTDPCDCRHLTGIGLDSTNKFLCKRHELEWISIARFTSPVMTAIHNMQSGGCYVGRHADVALAAAQHQGHPLSGRRPSRWQSLRRFTISMARSMLPVASLMPITPGT